jgi:hypothetical protein
VCHDTHNKDTQHNSKNGTPRITISTNQHCDTQSNSSTRHDTQHNSSQHNDKEYNCKKTLQCAVTLIIKTLSIIVKSDTQHNRKQHNDTHNNSYKCNTKHDHRQNNVTQYNSRKMQHSA